MTAPAPSPTDTPTAEPVVPAPVAPPAPVPTPPPPAPVEPAAPAATDAPADGDPADTPEIAKVRREAANYRTKLREQEQATAAAAAKAAEIEAKLTEQQTMLDAILKAAGVKGDEPPDPAALAEQLAAEKAQREAERAQLTEQHQQQVRDLTLRAALPAALAKAGANPDLTTAVLTASGALAQLDPTADTFASDLESAVASALDAHPQLKVAPVAVRSGTEIAGRSGGSDQLTMEQVRAMKPHEVEAARVAGRLRNLLGG